MIGHERQTANCDYCKLPIPGGAIAPAVDGEEREPSYCCFGCRFAADVTQGRGDEGEARWTFTRLGLAIFFTLASTVFTMALWTLDVYETDSATRLADLYHDLFRYLALLSSLPVLFLLGVPLFDSSIDALKRGRPTSDLLLGTGVAAAFAYSIVSVLTDHGQVYFEVGCVILVMVTAGRWLEANGKLKTTNSLERLETLLPAEVARIENGREVAVPLDQIEIGDQIRVRPGERIPTDGRLLSQATSVDEQILTGESRPKVRQRGDALHGGTLNIDGDIRIEVTAAGGAGTLNRLIEMVRQARASKGRYQQVADRVSAWFFPAISLIAVATVVGHTWASGLETGLMNGLAVVLIACPCALALATPMAVWTALGNAADHQVLFRGGEALERLAGVKAVRFDKTGTLTTGTPKLDRLVVESGTPEPEVRLRARTLAESSTHTLSHAIAHSLDDVIAPLPDVECRTEPGRGILAVFPGESEPTLLGSVRFLQERGIRIGPRLNAAIHQAEQKGQPLTLLAWDGLARGLFVFEEELRPSTPKALFTCHSLGLDIAVLTGDHNARGQALSGDLGVTVRAGLLPEQKVEAVREASRSIGTTAMVGDGINDAPALAASDVGIALGCGADVSRDSAQVCLLTDDLMQLPWSIHLARETVSVIRQNLAWSFGYNALGVVAAAAGWLNPVIAAVLMVVSSGLVIVNSLRLRGDAPSPEPVAEPAR